ncbi:MAG: LacI family DNA-binding transcriptional regulator [Sediminibacterium sp.]|nr:LacI family DNA-binding transcriptional regulator [Sediminibacterium sp.]
MQLKKIAEHFGVSVSTVSRALSNKTNISTPIRRKIKKYAESIGFVPDITASNLRKGQSNIIGIMVPSIANTFYESFLAEIERQTKKNNYSIITLQSFDNAEQELENIHIFQRLKICSLFVCLASGSNNEKKIVEEFKDKIVIFFDKVPMSGNYFTVTISDKEATELALNQLRLANKKNVLGIFSNPYFSITKFREKAFNEYFKNYKNITSNSKTINSTIRYSLNSDECMNILEQIWQGPSHPDCIFCMTDEILVSVMKFIQKKQIKYPKNIRIIALSNGSIPYYYYPEISFVQTNGGSLAALVFDFFIEIKNKETTELARMVKPIFFNNQSL